MAGRGWPVEDGVGIGQVVDYPVPRRYRQLAGNDRRAVPEALLERHASASAFTVLKSFQSLSKNRTIMDHFNALRKVMHYDNA